MTQVTTKVLTKCAAGFTGLVPRRKQIDETTKRVNEMYGPRKKKTRTPPPAPVGQPPGKSPTSVQQILSQTYNRMAAENPRVRQWGNVAKAYGQLGKTILSGKGPKWKGPK